MKKEKTFS